MTDPTELYSLVQLRPSVSALRVARVFGAPAAMVHLTDQLSAGTVVLKPRIDALSAVLLQVAEHEADHPRIAATVIERCAGDLALKSAVQQLAGETNTPADLALAWYLNAIERVSPAKASAVRRILDSIDRQSATSHAELTRTAAQSAPRAPRRPQRWAWAAAPVMVGFVVSAAYILWPTAKPGAPVEVSAAAPADSAPWSSPENATTSPLPEQLPRLDGLPGSKPNPNY